MVTVNIISGIDNMFRYFPSAVTGTKKAHVPHLSTYAYSIRIFFKVHLPAIPATGDPASCLGTTCSVMMISRALCLVSFDM